MFRKRRAVPPWFRTPPPFNPMTGKFAQFGPEGFKQLCRFTLDEELGTDDEFVSATIESQYGPGTDHVLTTINVYNLETSTPDTYLFEGASGAVGYAFWDKDTNWRIIQMECPSA